MSEHNRLPSQKTEGSFFLNAKRPVSGASVRRCYLRSCSCNYKISKEKTVTKQEHQPENPHLYTIIGLQLHNADNSGAKPVNATTNNIPAKAYCIRLEYTNQLKDSTHDQDDESPYRVLNHVKGFTITSLTDFDNLHPAGSSLNNYFLYTDDWYWPHVTSADSIQAHISNGSMGGLGAKHMVRTGRQNRIHHFCQQYVVFMGNRKALWPATD